MDDVVNVLAPSLDQNGLAGRGSYSPISSMLLTGDLGVKGDEERTPLRALGGRGRFLAAMRASTSRLSSSKAASIDITLCG